MAVSLGFHTTPLPWKVRKCTLTMPYFLFWDCRATTACCEWLSFYKRCCKKLCDAIKSYRLINHISDGSVVEINSIIVQLHEIIMQLPTSTVIVLMVFKMPYPMKGVRMPQRFILSFWVLNRMTPFYDCSHQKRGSARTTAWRNLNSQFPVLKLSRMLQIANHCHFIKVAARNCAMQSNEFAW